MLASLALAALTIGTSSASNSEISYAPYYVDCPTDIKLVREANGLSDNEASWVRGRKAVASKAFSDYLGRLNLTDFDLATYTESIQNNPDDNMPVIAYANSGGGWRSSFTGIGGLRAFDEKYPAAVQQGTGGLLQSMTYFAGLSGGSWAPTSFALNEYPAINDLVATWHVNVDRFSPTNTTQYSASPEEYFAQTISKMSAGFNYTVADWLGRAFAYEYIPGEEGGLNKTYSSIAELESFKQFAGPLTILQSNSLDTNSIVEYGLYVPRENSTIYEWNPFEFGSWNPEVGAFTPTKYVGTVPNAQGTAERCVQNLDQAGFVIASVASAYNYWWVGHVSNGALGSFSKRDIETRQQSNSSTIPFVEAFSPLIDAVIELKDYFERAFNLSLSQIANPSIPNPFGGKENITFADSSSAGQSIPFWSLIQPERKVDFIIAWDDDSDDAPYGWNNGTNVWNTYNLAKAAGLPFPNAPPPETFLARNYTLKPTFFGCNSSMTTTGDASTPIVLYMTNAPYSWYSNFTWTTFNMSNTEFNGVLDNSFNFVTQGNGTLDEGWVKCIGCAAIDRSLERMNMTRSDECEQCFQEHCWDGTTSQLPDNFVFDPSLQLDPSYGFDEWSETHPFSGVPYL